MGPQILIQGWSLVWPLQISIFPAGRNVLFKLRENMKPKYVKNVDNLGLKCIESIIIQASRCIVPNCMVCPYLLSFFVVLKGSKTV